MTKVDVFPLYSQEVSFRLVKSFLANIICNMNSMTGGRAPFTHPRGRWPGEFASIPLFDRNASQIIFPTIEVNYT